MQKFKSNIYKHYDFISQDNVETKTRVFKCKTCSQLIKAATTSNLITHLEQNDNHKEAFTLYTNDLKKKEESLIDSPQPRSKLKRVEFTSTSSPSAKLMESSFMKTVKYGNGSSIQKERTSLLLHMLAKCMLPMSLVENKNFINYISKLDPSLNMPTSK